MNANANLANFMSWDLRTQTQKTIMKAPFMRMSRCLKLLPMTFSQNAQRKWCSESFIINLIALFADTSKYLACDYHWVLWDYKSLQNSTHTEYLCKPLLLNPLTYSTGYGQLWLPGTLTKVVDLSKKTDSIELSNPSIAPFTSMGLPYILRPDISW